MKRVVLAFSVALLLTGCVSTNISKSRYPEAPAGFVPKEQYAVNFDAAWRAAEAVLDEERIPIVQSDRASGRIVTDYIDGESKMIIGLLGAVGTTTRYKFTITVTRAPGSGSRIRTFATLESSESGQGQWLNMNKDLPDQVRAIENWLAYKIDEQLAHGG